MASDKQIAGNQANAKKSTGPRTAAGRAKSGRNAYRRGSSVPLQDPQGLDALARAIVGKTAGEDQLQAQLELQGHQPPGRRDISSGAYESV